MMARSIFLPLSGLSCLIFFLNIPKASFQVTDVNECLDTQACPSKATCTDTVGSYFCACKSGYESSNGKRHFNDPGVTCIDKNECLNSTACPLTATCKNTRGSYLCVCNPGFETPDGGTQFIGSRGTCIDKNECLNSTACPLTATCKNTRGSYLCVCNPGFETPDRRAQFTGSRGTCIDKNECLNPALCSPTARCKNTRGSYLCVCNPGFETPDGGTQFTDSGGTCIRINPRSPIPTQVTFSEDYKQQGTTKDPNTPVSMVTKGVPEDNNVTLVLQEIADSFGNFSNISSRSSQRRKEEIACLATRYLHRVQSAAYEAALNRPTGGTLRRESQFMVIEVLTIKNSCETENEIVKLQTEKEAMDIDCSVVTGGGTGGAVVFISYKSFGSILDGSFVSKENLTLDEKLDHFQLNSKVISGTTGCKKNCSLAKSVNFTFHHIQMIEESKKSLCVYWDELAWSNEGCHVTFSDGARTVCSCSHLSTFAVLMASVKLKEDPVLTMITYVGLSLSLLCLFLAALTFLLCRSIQNTSTSLHLQLSICLFLAYLLFLTGIKRTEPKVLCKVIAGVLHYLYLAAFTWMFLEGLHLFLTVRNLKVANYTSAGRFKKRFMYPVGYGVPAVIVTVSAAINPQGYSTTNHCWINLENGFILSFLGPVSAVILINLIFYSITLWILRDRLSSLNKDVSKIQNTRMLTFKAIAQLFLLGCSWCLGFFLAELIKEPLRSILAYAFTITNVLQGVYIFLVHCLLNQQVREDYVKWLRSMSKKTESDSYILSSSTIQTHVDKLKSNMMPQTLEKKRHYLDKSEQSHCDETPLPIRLTSCIFQRPVTRITSHPGNVVRHHLCKGTLEKPPASLCIQETSGSSGLQPSRRTFQDHGQCKCFQDLCPA
ncbi:adhesion G protein-coupled receptor E3-like isoform X1 [Ovis aries]|uniref:adhesion G protein-coupled receptor E3-like isoform X1 n=2 Tax=Ovis aries TaxID=9940 RepID=UPI00295284E1|nr:adhesion G protein-coupled receptor E3-like isoform X1 [Ovis aries]